MNVEIMLSRIEELCRQKGISMTNAFVESGVGKNFKCNLKLANPSEGKIALLAMYFGISASYLKGECDTIDEQKKSVPKKEDRLYFESRENVYMIPLFDAVSAGFGAYADSSIIDYLPCSMSTAAEAEETICITVIGDSMSPKIEEGDIIQVRKQASVDSGSVAVALIDGEDAVVKKIIYGNGWLELHSFNPYYPVRRFEGAEMQRVQILGLVRKVIKDLN